MEDNTNSLNSFGDEHGKDTKKEYAKKLYNLLNNKTLSLQQKESLFNTKNDIT